MTTSRQQTSPRGEDESTYSQEASLASPSVMPGDEEARTMTATSGRKCSALSTKSGPLGSLVKTLLESSRWSSRARFLQWQAKPLCSVRVTEFSDSDKSNPSPSNASATTLRALDMPSNRCLFQLVPLGPRTEETECSSSPMLKTPCTWDCMELKSWDTSRDRGTLGQQAMMGKLDNLLPTPLSQGLKYCDEKGVTRFVDLNMLPTPTAIEGEKWTNVMLLTHSASDGLRGNFTMDSLMRHNKPNAEKSNLAEQIAHAIGGGTSRLSPLFTEEMMGFPLMWTALPFLSQNGETKASKPTATPSSHK